MRGWKYGVWSRSAGSIAATPPSPPKSRGRTSTPDRLLYLQHSKQRHVKYHLGYIEENLHSLLRHTHISIALRHAIDGRSFQAVRFSEPDMIELDAESLT
jgi:hypothetical protein